ncbi:MAG TPA: porin family protein [Ignavibacteria bacterium]|nr:porin family protein [Ignavibacteria bacterium]
MKKIVCSIAFICILFQFAQAQQFRFGLTASPVFNWYSIDGDTYSNDGLRLGFEYGILFDQTIGNVERYAFATGLIINSGGGGIIYSDSLGNNVTFTNRVQYIDIPLTIKLRTNEVNYVTYYGLFGLTPGIAIRARGDAEFDPDPFGLTTLDFDLRKDNDLNYKYQPVAMSLTLGAGMEYAMTENTALTGGIFFQNGFTNVINDDDSNASGAEDNNTRLKQFGIRLGVLF